MQLHSTGNLQLPLYQANVCFLCNLHMIILYGYYTLYLRKT